MSNIAKRKFVFHEITQEFHLPKDNQTICKILESRSNNLFQVVSSEGEIVLASMPTKYRQSVYVTIGDFVLTEPIMEGKKVKAEIVRILIDEQIRYLIDNHCWPNEFMDSAHVKKYTKKMEINMKQKDTQSAWDNLVPDSESETSSEVGSVDEEESKSL